MGLIIRISLKINGVNIRCLFIFVKETFGKRLKNAWIGIWNVILFQAKETAMQKTTHSFVTFIALFVLIATLTSTAYAAPAARAKWTVMVYMSGDNNLE